MLYLLKNLSLVLITYLLTKVKTFQKFSLMYVKRLSAKKFIWQVMFFKISLIL